MTSNESPSLSGAPPAGEPNRVELPAAEAECLRFLPPGAQDYENYIYLGLISHVHFFLHVIYTTRNRDLVIRMSGDIYGAMIHAELIQAGQKIVVFNLFINTRRKRVLPVLANHVTFPPMTGLSSGALDTVLQHLLAAKRENLLIIKASFVHGVPSLYTMVEIKSSGPIYAGSECLADPSAFDPLETVLSLKTIPYLGLGGPNADTALRGTASLGSVSAPVAGTVPEAL